MNGGTHTCPLFIGYSESEVYMGNTFHIPFGLVRHTHEQAEINFKPCYGLRTALELQEQGLVTVKLVRTHTQQYNKMCNTEF